MRRETEMRRGREVEGEGRDREKMRRKRDHFTDGGGMSGDRERGGGIERGGGREGERMIRGSAR